MKLFLITVLFSVFCGSTLHSQADSTPTIHVSGYLEAYYSYDIGASKVHDQPNFFYSYNRNNEVNLNLGLVRASYNSDNIRGGLGFMLGTYSQANMVNEPSLLKNIFEAQMGLKLSEKKNLWLDVGIFASHIGFESAIGKDCWTLNRSLQADNSPYFESGAKITYITPKEKWTLMGLILNGWQQIARKEGESMPAFGHQIIFQPNKNILLNSSSFVGNVRVLTKNELRIYHNLYTQWTLNSKFTLFVGLDAGMQESFSDTGSYRYWYTPNIMLKQKLNSKSYMVYRLENFNDKNNLMINVNSLNTNIIGSSITFASKIRNQALWKVECRDLYNSTLMFWMNDMKLSSHNFSIATSLALSF